MLEKRTLYIKDIIFIKITLYILAGIGLLIILSILDSQIEQYSKKITIAKLQIKQTQENIAFFAKKNQNMETLIDTYQTFRNTPYIGLCNLRRGVLADLQSLNDMFKLYVPINLNVSFPKNIQNQLKIHHLYVKALDTKLTFYVSSFDEFLDISKTAYKMLPKFSTIESINIEKETVVTPENIQRILPNKKSNLITCIMSMQTKEIIPHE